MFVAVCLPEAELYSSVILRVDLTTKKTGIKQFYQSEELSQTLLNRNSVLQEC